jgi:hypothetical protein
MFYADPALDASSPPPNEAQALPQNFAEISPYIQPIAARIIPDKLEFLVTEFEAISELLQHRGERLAAKFSDRCLDAAIAALHRTAFLNLYVERLALSILA